MRYKYFYILLIFTIALNSCTVNYSFTGGKDLHPNVKTVTVDFFPNRASLVQPNLSNVFTEALKNKFVSQTNLELVNYGGDITFEGEITNYDVAAQAFQGNETAALNRLTISIKVKYTNAIEPNKSFESIFTRYADFESSQSLMAVEGDLIQQISDEIVVDIYNRTVVNW